MNSLLDQLKKRLAFDQNYIWETYIGEMDIEVFDYLDVCEGAIIERARTAKVEAALIAHFESSQEIFGGWFSAAIEDPMVCDEMKADLTAWFETFTALRMAVESDSREDDIRASGNVPHEDYK
jgi:hypothetical protein